MTEQQETPPEKPPRERSPSFPFISLRVAVKRLREFEAKFGRHPAPASKAGLAWAMKEKSSQAYQTLAALRAFGLMSYEGSGDKRMAVLTDAGRIYLRAQQEHIKSDILKKAALKPKQIGKFWTDWRHDPPPDELRLDLLVLENAFTDGAAKIFLNVYDDTIGYAGLSQSGKIDAGEENDEDEPNIKVDNWVQWTSQGSLQFPTPRRVIKVFKDAEHGWQVSVEGYPGALPMEQIEVTGPAKPAVPSPAPNQKASTESSNAIDVFLSGGRLQISANIDRTGIPKLKLMLDKYDEIFGLEDDED